MDELVARSWNSGRGNDETIMSTGGRAGSGLEREGVMVEQTKERRLVGIEVPEGSRELLAVTGMMVLLIDENGG